MKIGVTSEPLFKFNGPIAAVIVSLLLFGCLGTSNTKTNEGAVVLTNSIVQGEAMANQTASNQKTIANPIVTFVTTKGTFQAEIFQDKATITSSNFLKLVKSGFYNGLTFHRYVEKFVIQGGDPKGDGTGGSKDAIPLEIIPGLIHTKGALAMARTMDPNSATSQFYIALEDLPQLNGNYAVFGRVTSGMDVVLKLRQDDRMISVSVTSG